MLPSPRLILWTLPAAGFFLASAFLPPWRGIGLVYLLCLLLASILDAALLPGRARLRVRRVLPRRLSLNVPATIRYEVQNLSRRRVRVRLAEAFAAGLEAVGGAAGGVLGPGEAAEWECRWVGRARGRHEWPGLDVRVGGVPGLVIRQFRFRGPSAVDVFPNLQDLRRYELILRRGGAMAPGVARMRGLGQGSEFESLRLLEPGDEMSRVDWKATARRSKLLVRNYEPERHQSVLVALDAGQATAAEAGGISWLDTYLDATLMLAYAAMRQGDTFSLVAFSDRIETYLPPVRGLHTVERTARAVFALQPRMVAADYVGLCRFLDQRGRKRSLICLMTDVIDREASAVIIAHMARFARRHVPLVVALRNPEVQALADAPLSPGSGPYATAAASDMLAAREEALVSLRRLGVGVLECLPRSLTPQLVQRYLEMKTARRI